MDFELDDDQRAILEAVDRLLEQHAGPARAIALQAEEAYDDALDAALRDAGFTDALRSGETGPLEAALICHEVARAAGVVGFAAEALVAPRTSDEPLPGPVALATAGQRGPIRFGAHARSLLVLDREGGCVRRLELAPGESKPVRSSFGYPMGSVPEGLAQRGRPLAQGSAGRLERWWRLALALEAAGTMKAALDQTVGYLKERRQFGRPIGSFQAVQHRLAGCAIAVEGSRWLAWEAAFQDAPAEGSAAAASYALSAAARVFAETHQLSGAIGFTREHDLHVFSMRLQALRLELDGLRGHRRALAAARWQAGGEA